MKKSLMFLFPIVSIIILLWIEQVLTVPYTTKTLAKILLFAGIPLILFYKKGFTFLHFRNVDRQSLSASILLGISIMTIIVFAFIKLRAFIDLDGLILALEDIGVTSTVFPFIALYILFGNSILEEFFFRGFLASFFNTYLESYLNTFFVICGLSYFNFLDMVFIATPCACCFRALDWRHYLPTC